MQIKHKTYRFQTHTKWSGERRGIMSAVGRPNISVGSPPEFKGDGTVWAPEELMHSIGVFEYPLDVAVIASQRHATAFYEG